MKTAGFTTDDRLFRRLLNDRDRRVVRLESVPMHAVFRVYSVEQYFDGRRHVPKLRINGELERVTPALAEMPFDVRQVTFSLDDAPPVTADYEFNHEQLMTLVDKGLFMEGFTPPVDTLTSHQWEFLINGDIEIIAPTAPGEPPLVAVDVSELDQFVMTYDNTGYELEALFTDHRALVEASGVAVGHGVSGELSANRDFQNLFGEELFDAEVDRLRVERETRESVFDRPAVDIFDHELKSDQFLRTMADEQGALSAEELERLARQEHLTPWEEEVKRVYEEKLSLARVDLFGEDDFDDADFDDASLDDAVDVGDLGDLDFDVDFGDEVDVDAPADSGDELAGEGPVDVAASLGAEVIAEAEAEAEARAETTEDRGGAGDRDDRESDADLEAEGEGAIRLEDVLEEMERSDGASAGVVVPENASSEIARKSRQMRQGRAEREARRQRIAEKMRESDTPAPDASSPEEGLEL